jgi:ABC-2 type transport system permease protein
MSAESVIHDIGYQRYDGPRLGRAYATRSLYVHGLRTAFGLGRSAKSKIFPWAVGGIVFFVAIVLVAIRSQGVDLPLTYWNFANGVWLLLAVFCAVVAPELVSRDLRNTVLPLYFSRPLTRVDYASAKLAAMVTALWLLLAGPMTVMLLGGVFSVDGMSAVWTEVGHWLQGLLVAGVYALIFGALALLIASLASRRGVAAALIAASLLVTFAVYGIVLAIAASGAVRDGAEPGSAGVAAVTAGQWAGVVSPATLADGLASWWFGPPIEINDVQVSAVGGYGPLYLVVSVLFVAACSGLLLLRYRKVAR